MALFRRRERRPLPGQIVIDPQDPHLRAAVKLAILGSAYDTTTEDGKILAAITQPWQLEALGYRNTLGEIRYAADFYARPLRRLKLWVGEENDDGDIVPTKNPTAKEILRQVHDPGSRGRQALLTEYGRLMFCTGEGLLTWTPAVPDASVPRPESWEMLSQVEMRPAPDGKTWQRYRTGRTQDSETFPTDGRVYRLWQRDAMYSDLADAPMRAVLDLCVAAGTMVSTPTGARRVEDVRAGDEVWAWRRGEMVKRRVTAAASTGDNETLKIVAGRRTIRCTPEHRLLVMRQTKPGKGRDAVVTTEWVRASDIEKGDELVAANKIPSQSPGWVLPDGTAGSEGIAYLLGQVTGDGHISKHTVKISTFNAARDETLSAIVRDAWSLEPRRRGSGNIAWHSVHLVRLLSLLGLRCPAPKKRVPPIVWQMPDTDKRAFLRGYEDADGHLTPRGWQSHATSSPELARELRHLYIELGENVSNLHVEARPEGGMRVAGNARVSVAALPLNRFQVYYGSKRKGDGGTLRTRAQRAVIGESFTLARVKRIESAGVVETFDLTVPDADCFIADGIVAHNCEELAILTLVVRARAISRLAGNGILFIPDNITVVAPKLPDGSPKPAENPRSDPLLAALIKAILAPIEDQGAASSVAPLLLRGNPEAGKEIRHISVRDVQEAFPEIALRDQTIARLAISLDMPREDLEGIGDVNHWGGWQIERDKWRHVEPVANQMVEDFTTAILRPSLIEEGVADPDRFVVMYDASEILTNPDRGEDAKQAFTFGVIGPKAYRSAMGWDEDDAPTPEEIPTMLLFLGKTAVEPDAPADDPEQDAPDDDTGEDDASAASSNGRGDQRVWALQAFADAMVIRHREIAGVRLKAKTKDTAVLTRIAGVPNDQIAVVVGSAADMTGVNVSELVACNASLMETGALRQGVSEKDAKALASIVETHAARTLWQEHPPAFPVAAIRSVLE